MKHQKRIALVTGANKGIGFAISRRLAKEGITVVMGAAIYKKVKQPVSSFPKKAWKCIFN